MKKTKVITCGCRFNRFESEEIKKLLSGDNRELVVINTCAVTKKSEAKSRHEVRRAIRENPGAAIVVAGCLAEFSPSAVSGIEGVDLVLGNEEKFRAGELIEKNENVFVGDVKKTSTFLELNADIPEDRTSAYLKIQNGCDEKCTFCVVRLVRGNSRSASPDFILKRIDDFLAIGTKEIVLTGINIGQYGKDLPCAISLGEVLKSASSKGKGDFRIRLSSINPHEITDDLIEVIAAAENICRHLHIPMQSGSDKILQNMKRPYTAGHYREKIEKIAAKIHGLALGCDVMAGFPGETENDFKETATILNDLPFSYAHVFPYSPRETTAAFEMMDDVPPALKQERVALLKHIAEKKNLEFREKMQGKEFNVLVEERKSIEPGFLKGKTDTFITADFPGQPDLKGKLVKIRINGLTERGVKGTIV